MKAWSEDEIRVASSLRRSGARVKTIARRLNRQTAGVAKKLLSLGVKKGRPPGISGPLAEEIAAAKAEWSTAPLYRPGNFEWMR